MEQGVIENSLVLLKYKFYAFYDLNPKVSYDVFLSLTFENRTRIVLSAVRIHLSGVTTDTVSDYSRMEHKYLQIQHKRIK